MSKSETYYVRSTGEVIGPNVMGENMGRKNLQRLEHNNLFTSKRQAERAAYLIRLLLKVVNWSKP